MNSNALAVGALAYASTNVDDLILLTGLLADRPDRRRTILAGHSMAMAALVAISMSLAQAASALPRPLLACLAVAPILLGISKLAMAPRSLPAPAMAGRPAGEGPIAVAGVLLAAGGDNLAVYIPTFVLQPKSAYGSILASFGVLSLVWFLGALTIVTVLGASGRASRAPSPLSPWILIGLGSWSVWNGFNA